jgi:hypothetical protein
MSALFDINVYHFDRKSLNISKKKEGGKTTDTVQVDVSDSGLPPDVQRFSADLTRGSHRLRPLSDITKIRLIVTTPHSFLNRHGPARLRQSRIVELKASLSKGSISKSAYEHRYKDIVSGPDFARPSRKWEYDLQGCFAGVIVDEAHLMRNPYSQANITLRWLDAPKVILATATPVWNAVSDIRGYLSLLQTKEARSLARTINETVTKDFTDTHYNPYSAKRRAARMLSSGLPPIEDRKRSICLDTFDKYTQGKPECSNEALEVIFEECLVRHNYSSSCPKGHPEYAIAKNLPNGYRYTVDAWLSVDMGHIFDYYAEPQYARIRMPISGVRAGQVGNDKGKDLGINTNSHRALTAASTWPALMLIGVSEENVHITSQKAQLDHNRAAHVDRTRAVAQEKIFKKKREEADKDEEKQWTGYPDSEYPITEDELPSTFPPLTTSEMLKPSYDRPSVQVMR